MKSDSNMISDFLRLNRIKSIHAHTYTHIHIYIYTLEEKEKERERRATLHVHLMQNILFGYYYLVTRNRKNAKDRPPCPAPPNKTFTHFIHLKKSGPRRKQRDETPDYSRSLCQRTLRHVRR